MEYFWNISLILQCYVGSLNSNPENLYIQTIDSDRWKFIL